MICLDSCTWWKWSEFPQCQSQDKCKESDTWGNVLHTLIQHRSTTVADSGRRSHQWTREHQSQHLLARCQSDTSKSQHPATSSTKSRSSEYLGRCRVRLHSNFKSWNSVMWRCLKQRLEETGDGSGTTIFQLSSGLTRLQAAKLFYQICGKIPWVRSQSNSGFYSHSFSWIHQSTSECPIWRHFHWSWSQHVKTFHISLLFLFTLPFHLTHHSHKSFLCVTKIELEEYYIEQFRCIVLETLLWMHPWTASNHKTSKLSLQLAVELASSHSTSTSVHHRWQPPIHPTPQTQPTQQSLQFLHCNLQLVLSSTLKDLWALPKNWHTLHDLIKSKTVT